MESLVGYERGICDCGFHESLAADEGNRFRIEAKKCPVCAAKDQSDRIQSEADETFREQTWGKEKPANREDPADGRTFGIRHMGRAEPAS